MEWNDKGGIGAMDWAGTHRNGIEQDRTGQDRTGWDRIGWDGNTARYHLRAGTVPSTPRSIC